MEQFSATQVVLLLNKVGNKVFPHRESGYNLILTLFFIT